MAATSSTAIVPQILDGKHDYKDWSVRVKTYLLSKDLWDVVETASEPLEQEGVWEFKFKAWRKNNAEALHAIQLSCGPRTFPLIRDKTTAKAAWDTLEAQFNREESSDEIPHEYHAFFAAVRRGDWQETEKFLNQHPNAKTATDSWGTALHNATICGHEKIVEELVQLMTKEDLERKASGGWTALGYAARDNLKMVECMVTRNRELLSIAVESWQRIPIVIAARYDQWDIVRYLYPFTPREDLMPDKGPYGSELVSFCLFAEQFGIHIEHVPSINDFRINIQNQENEQGINRIRELKLIHVWSRQIVGCMCEVIKQLNHEEMRDGDVYDAIFAAVENGIVELVISLCKAKPELLWTCNTSGKYLFQYSVECRQEKVFNLIYGIGKKNLLTTFKDYSDNGMLHYAGMLSPLAKLDPIPGAALQMQRERQWYKEVESIVVQLSGVPTKNKDGLTPPKLFTQSHKKLHEDGERWMKETARSYTVVSALIITIMFAAAFTVPGGDNQETGFPIFLNENLFMVFVISDAISLFSSATSALMFLGILTSRYAEDDFLKSLPTKMIIGLSTLFISVATMMIAFSSALFIMLQDKSWIVSPIIFLAAVPVILFIWMQSPLLLEIIVSTYGRGIFDKKVKRWM
ncbi:unnamed protein product [Malus baccata var. baccata]